MKVEWPKCIYKKPLSGSPEVRVQDEKESRLQFRNVDLYLCGPCKCEYTRIQPIFFVVSRERLWVQCKC